MESQKVKGHSRSVALNKARPAEDQLAICRGNSKKKGVSCWDEYSIKMGTDNYIHYRSVRGRVRKCLPEIPIYRSSKAGWVCDQEYLRMRQIGQR